MLWSTSYVYRWALAIAITLAVEMPIVAALTRTDEPRASRRLAAAFVANAVSHPGLFLGLASLVAVTGWVLAGGEAAVVVFEALVYRWGLSLPAGRALGVSLGANLASLAAGAAIHALTGWP